MKVGFTCGSFDLLHPGHVTMLEICKDNCDCLIVGLHTDPTIDRPLKNKPIQTVYERYVQLNSLRCVDRIIPYDTERDLENLLSVEPIDIRFIGEDYFHSNTITGIQTCEKRGIEIFFVERKHDWSSSELRKRVENAISQDKSNSSQTSSVS